MMCYPSSVEWSVFESLSDRLDCYLADQQAFRKGYTFDALWNDIHDDLMLHEPEGPHELTLADWKDEFLSPDELLALDAPKHRERARKSRTAKRDPWMSVPKLDKRARGFLVEHSLPFIVHAARLMQPQHQRRKWERQAGSVWCLLISGGWTGQRILTLAPNYYRNRMLGNLSVPMTMCLVGCVSVKGRAYFDLQTAPSDRLTEVKP